MKWILIMILIVVVMLIAHSLSEQYKDKYDFYNNLKIFLNQFKINLSFKQEKIKDFLSNNKSKKQFKLFVDDFNVYLNTSNIDLNNLKLLEQDEKDVLEDIIKGIGNYDSTNEINQINSFLEIIEVKLEKAMREKNKLCPMIIKLSLLFSIGLAIILI